MKFAFRDRLYEKLIQLVDNTGTKQGYVAPGEKEIEILRALDGYFSLKSQKLERGDRDPTRIIGVPKSLIEEIRISPEFRTELRDFLNSNLAHEDHKHNRLLYISFFNLMARLFGDAKDSEPGIPNLA